MSRPTVVIVCMFGSSESGGLNSTHIHGTHVPVEEPSTASAADIECVVIDNRLDKSLGSRAHISTVTLRFSPSFGSSPVNLALANSKAAIAVLAGPSHNSAVRGSINSRHTSGSVGPPRHHTSSVFRQTTSVWAASRMTLARPVIDRYALSFGSMKA